VKKLLGWKITRNTGTPKESSHDVWVGFTGEEMEKRKEFVKGFNHSAEFDGYLRFDYIESDVVVTEPGMYLAEGLIHGFRVSGIKEGGIECVGFTQKLTAKGKRKDNRCMWFYTNGEPFASANRVQRLTRKMPA
jgi:hypothetical protein